MVWTQTYSASEVCLNLHYCLSLFLSLKQFLFLVYSKVIQLYLCIYFHIIFCYGLIQNTAICGVTQSRTRLKRLSSSSSSSSIPLYTGTAASSSIYLLMATQIASVSWLL